MLQRHGFCISCENVWNIVFDAAGKSSYWKSRPVLAEDSYYVSTEPSLQGLATSLMTKLLTKHAEIMLARPDANSQRLRPF